MTWRVAKSLDILLREINALSPNRDKSSDGSIGDEHHASRSSDHNPWVHDTDGTGIVTARDFTNDPKHGIVSDVIAHNLINSRDERIKYIISNGKIASGSGQQQPAWVWRKYTGTNPHDHHCHVSVKQDKAHYDDDAPWQLGITVTPVVANAKPAVLKYPLLRVGNTGEDVKRLQYLLTVAGYRIRQDGDFGAGTKKAVIDFQKKSELVADGVVGPYTWKALEDE
jgi:putative peptidoglycan binding protein